MTDIPFEQYVFLDFEASSLDPNSWPIELGVSWITSDLKVETYANLIKPSPDWFEDAWSPVSAEVHNIPRRDLDTAPDLEVVARDFLTILGDRIALSDAPAFERHWLETLLETAQLVNTVQIQDFDATTFKTFPKTALDHIFERLMRGQTKHRAGDDSAKMAHAWVVGLQYSRSSEGGL
jgi:DNA polymerase-3 subunit epsilon